MQITLLAYTISSEIGLWSRHDRTGASRVGLFSGEDRVRKTCELRRVYVLLVLWATATASESVVECRYLYRYRYRYRCYCVEAESPMDDDHVSVACPHLYCLRVVLSTLDRRPPPSPSGPNHVLVAHHHPYALVSSPYSAPLLPLRPILARSSASRVQASRPTWPRTAYIT